MVSSTKSGSPKRLAFVRPMFFSALLGMLIWVTSPAARIDDVWSDFLLTCQAKPAAGNVVVLEISADDVIAHGQERLSREYLADTLEKLNDLRVNRVLLDFNLGAGVTPAEEKKLDQAMRRFGPNRLAIAFERDHTLRTKDSLLKHTTTVDLAFTPDADGRLRTLYKDSLDIQPNPVAWLEGGVIQLTPTLIDRRIDPTTVPKLTLGEFHKGEYPQNMFDGKLVVISLDRQLSKMRSQLPIHGRVDRGTILAMATESRMDGYDQKAAIAEVLSMITNIILVLGGYLIGAQAPNVKRALWGIFWVSTLAIAFSWNLCMFYGVPSRPGTILLTSALALYVALAYRLKVLELIGGLLSGVLSPEEVWLWRVYGEKNAPVVLFDAMGHIKRANKHAIHAFALSEAEFSSKTSALAKLTMPNVGERCENIIWSGPPKSVWKLDWPSHSLPLAVFDDITSHQEEISRLQTQLYTDPMTSEANRAGFERAIATLRNATDETFAIIFMDMNGFKAVNDTYGHDAGDILLKVAAQRFRKVIGPNAVLARLGGDEFAIIVRDVHSPNQLLDLRDSLEASLDERVDIGQCTVKVGVAAGYAIRENNQEDSSNVLKRADHAMYERKAFLKSRPSTLVLPQMMTSTPVIV
jgi:diguanylate cyclase (GGDEF)-like protein